MLLHKLMLISFLTAGAVPCVSAAQPKPADKDAAKPLATARELIAMYGQDGNYSNLESAWTAISKVLENSANSEDTAAAIKLAADVIPRLRIDLIKPWLVAKTKEKPD